MTKLVLPPFNIHEVVQARRDQQRKFDIAWSEMMQDVARGRHTIARTRALLADADAMLACNKQLLMGAPRLPHGGPLCNRQRLDMPGQDQVTVRDR